MVHGTVTGGPERKRRLEPVGVIFLSFFFLVEISINAHNAVWTESTPDISEPREGILKDTGGDGTHALGVQANLQRRLISLKSRREKKNLFSLACLAGALPLALTPPYLYPPSQFRQGFDKSQRGL